MSRVQGKIQWSKSRSPDVMKYRIYWSNGIQRVTYRSPYIEVGKNVNEIKVPIGNMPPWVGFMHFGIAAIDAHGNISDIAHLRAFSPARKPGPIQSIFNWFKNII